jgi:indolepyruvate ferredoxin oxidoreductase alpha subunit
MVIEQEKRLTIVSDVPGQRMFMLGNEAIARGAIEAGVQIAAAYPGTPSSEVMETLAEYAKGLDIYAEWSINEKVAFEIALAASMSGLRTMACMKHVGLNVAHDAVMSASYIGAIGGLVLLVADDPSAWSSQNEQDNRYIAEQGFIPVLEPSSVQEAKDMLVDAFRLSEEFKHMFIVRTVTRIGHGRSDVMLGEISRERKSGIFKRDVSRFVLTPAAARYNKPLMLRRFENIKEAVNDLPYNALNLVKSARTGIIACGISYSYTVEALKWLGIDDKVSLLKIGTPNPLPAKLIAKLLESVEKVLIVEELDPFVETHVKSLVVDGNIQVKVHGKDLLTGNGELSTRSVVEAISALDEYKTPVDFSRLDELNKQIGPILPARPPALCAGCPHRASLYAIKTAAKRVARDMGEDVEPVYPSDIGCYTLGLNPPLEAVDTVVCMGASFGIANGLAHSIKVPIVAAIGDSTFFHSGIPPMINAVYNQADITMVVLDNSATAMTGFQPHPGTGSTATGDKAPALKPEDIARACGVQFVEIVDPFDLKNAISVFEKAIRFKGPSMVISRRLCAMVEQKERRKSGEKAPIYKVDTAKCNDKCDTCISVLGCPAITRDGTKAYIDSFTCTGCGVCVQICPYKAIVQE